MSHQRLRSAAEFQRVFKQPQRFSDPLVTVLARANDAGYPRLGLAISRKAVRRAVGRNRIKRLVRESFRLSRSLLPNVDLVVMARPGIAELSNREILECLLAHWRRVAKRCAN